MAAASQQLTTHVTHSLWQLSPLHSEQHESIAYNALETQSIAAEYIAAELSQLQLETAVAMMDVVTTQPCDIETTHAVAIAVASIVL